MWLIVEVTIDICANAPFEINERVEGLSWIEFKELLSVATKESYFIFNKKLYKIVDEVPMGSHFDLTLDNRFF